MSDLKPGWADKIDPALVGLDDFEQTIKQRGGKRWRSVQPGSEAWRESARRGTRRGVISRIARKKLADI